MCFILSLNTVPFCPLKKTGMALIFFIKYGLSEVQEASRVGALDLGISPNPLANSKPPKFVFLLGADDIRVD